MTSTKAETAVTPPYAPWTTFRSFFETLKNTAIPPQVDSSVMSKMSGSAQTQVRGALRFFNLIDDGGTVQPRLRDVVNSLGTEDWRAVWSDVFFQNYSTIVGDLDIDSATLKQLADRFRDNAKIGGSVLRKALRFYLDGLAATGTTYSPHFKARGLSVIAGDRDPRRRAAPKANTQKEPALAPADNGKPGHPVHPHRVSVDDGFPIRLPGRPLFVLPLPHDLREAEWDFIDHQVRGFMKLRETP